MKKEDVQNARQANLAEYLLSNGVPLKKEGKRFRHNLINGLIITDNAFFDNITGVHGNAIDYLVDYLHYSSKDAIEELLKFQSLNGVATTDRLQLHDSVPTFKWEDIKTSKDMRRSISYLTKTRGISLDTVQAIIKANLLFQEESTNNAVFAIKNEKRQIVGAEIVGTLTDRRFKSIKAGSLYGYGFNIKYGNDTKYILFLESAIDMLSFIDISKDKGKPLSCCTIVSLSGLKINIFENMLNIFGSDAIPVLCTDNDLPSRDFANRVKTKRKDILERYPKAHFKDWNEQLLNERFGTGKKQ